MASGTKAIVAALIANTGIAATMHLGPEELLVAAKIAVREGQSAADCARAIDAAERRIREAVPIARLIYLEPDIDRGPADRAAG